MKNDLEWYDDHDESTHFAYSKVHDEGSPLTYKIMPHPGVPSMWTLAESDGELGLDLANTCYASLIAAKADAEFIESVNLFGGGIE